MSAPPDGTAAPRTRAVALPLAVAGLCFLVVALLGAVVSAGLPAQRQLDRTFSRALYAGDDRARWLDVTLEVLTAPGLSLVRLVVAVPVLLWLVRRQAWRTTIWVVAAAVLITPITAALKEAFGRVRPAFEDGGARYDSLSFPSGHSSGIATLVAVGLLLAWPLLDPPARRLWTAVGVLVALLVGLTRIWLGVHYPTDVVAGWALGLGWTLLTAVALGVLPLREGELR